MKQLTTTRDFIPEIEGSELWLPIGQFKKVWYLVQKPKISIESLEVGHLYQFAAKFEKHCIKPRDMSHYYFDNEKQW
jgi:hypothetical protein